MTNEEQHKKEWIHVKDFQDDKIIVRVTELQAYRPRYSIEIGRANEDNKVIRHFGVFVDTTLGKVTIRESIADRVAALIKLAEDWIHEKTQSREDDIIQERIDKEKRDADRNKPNTRITGKTEREKAKDT